MKIHLPWAYIGLLIFCFACSKKDSSGSSKRSPLHQFKSLDLAQHREKMGEPDSIKEKVKDSRGTKFLVYKSTEYQVDGEAVVAAIRVPEGQEVYLQYWLQKLQGYPCEWETVATNSHEASEDQYICKNDGLTLVYDRALERVLKVVEYESR